MRRRKRIYNRAHMWPAKHKIFTICSFTEKSLWIPILKKKSWLFLCLPVVDGKNDPGSSSLPKPCVFPLCHWPQPQSAWPMKCLPNRLENHWYDCTCSLVPLPLLWEHASAKRAIRWESRGAKPRHLSHHSWGHHRSANSQLTLQHVSKPSQDKESYLGDSWPTCMGNKCYLSYATEVLLHSKICYAFFLFTHHLQKTPKKTVLASVFIKIKASLPAFILAFEYKHMPEIHRLVTLVR